MSSELPDHIGSYEIDGELGRGAMGVVFRAHHEYTQREVALKVLFDQVAAHDIGVERFRREVSVSSRVNDPGVVEIFDAGPYKDTYYYAMEMLAGEELGEVAPNLSLAERLRLMVDVCRSLGACHDAGIVHRDLKPENIFVVDDDHTLTKIFDFGISSMRDAPRATATGNVVGTPVFMSPEQATDAGQVTPAADVWSVGVILYELTTGRLPVDAESSTQVLIQVANADLNYLEYTDDYPDSLVDLINKCLAPDPEARFADAAHLHEALRDVLDTHEWDEPDRRSSIPDAYTPKPLTMTHDSGPGGGFAPTEGISQTLPNAGGSEPTSPPTDDAPQPPAQNRDNPAARASTEHAADSPSDPQRSAVESINATQSTRRSVAFALVICGFVAVGILGGVIFLWSDDTQRTQAVKSAIARATYQIDRTLHSSESTLDAHQDARQAAMRRARQLHIETLGGPTMPQGESTRREVARIRARSNDDAPPPSPTHLESPPSDETTGTAYDDTDPQATADSTQTPAPSADAPTAPSGTDTDPAEDTTSKTPEPVAEQGAAPRDDADSAPDAGGTDETETSETTNAVGMGETSPADDGDKQGAVSDKQPTASSGDSESTGTGGTDASAETESSTASTSSDRQGDDNKNETGSSTEAEQTSEPSSNTKPADKDDADTQQKDSDDDQKPEFFSF